MTGAPKRRRRRAPKNKKEQKPYRCTDPRQTDLETYLRDRRQMDRPEMQNGFALLDETIKQVMKEAFGDD